jgi:hypothetical protein
MNLTRAPINLPSARSAVGVYPDRRSCPRRDQVGRLGVTCVLTSLVKVSRHARRTLPSLHSCDSSPFPVVDPHSIQQLTKCSSRNSFVLNSIHLMEGGIPPLQGNHELTTKNSISTIEFQQLQQDTLHPVRLCGSWITGRESRSPATSFHSSETAWAQREEY